MGNRYYASVTFPAAAKSIPEVAEAMKEYEIDHEDDEVIKVYDHEANYGQMDQITNVLDDHKVPYDHEESPGSSEEVNQTHHVRWPASADRVANVLVTGEDKPTTTTLLEADYEVSELANTWLGLLEAGNLTELRRCLEAKVNLVAVADLEWTPPT